VREHTLNEIGIVRNDIIGVMILASSYVPQPNAKTTDEKFAVAHVVDMEGVSKDYQYTVVVLDEFVEELERWGDTHLWQGAILTLVTNLHTKKHGGLDS